MKKYIINCILALILLFGLTKFFISERDNQRSQLDYDQAVQIAGAQHMEQNSQTEFGQSHHSADTPRLFNQAVKPFKP